MIKAEIIAIGDELLIGQTLDTNSNYIATQLSGLGISLRQISVISDKKEDIISALDLALSRSVLVFITGGLGPTKDDITKYTLTEYFGGELVLNQERLLELEFFYSQRQRVLNELNKTQALLPNNCTVLHNAVGTACGMWFEKEGKVVISMPGVPFEMKHLLEVHAFPKIKSFFKTPYILHKTFRTIGIPESDLALKIADWENALPENIKLAYLPSMFTVKLRLSALSENVNETKRIFDVLTSELNKLISEYIYADEDVNFEEFMANLLKNKKLTIATAESCTGGYLSHLLTSISGSSSYFKGSIVAYQNEIKTDFLNVPQEIIQTKGAVSQECVEIMAKEIASKFNSDIGVAVSGIAGPDGGTPEKPVGTVWLAVFYQNKVFSKKCSLLRVRELNIQISALYALDFVRKIITNLN